MSDATPSSPESDASSVEERLRALRMVLRKTESRRRVPLIKEGALWFLATCGALVISALLISAIFGDAVREIVPVLLLGGVGITTVCALIGAARLHFGEVDVRRTARFVQKHAPAFRHDIVTAINFAEKLIAGEFDAKAQSPSLARTHVVRTTSAVMDATEHGHLGHLLPDRDLRPAASALAGCVMLVLAPFGIAPQWAIDSLTGSVREAIEDSVNTPPERPVVGNLTLTIKPPSYTGLGERFEPFTTGNITVVQGSEVTVQGYALLGRTEQMDLVLKTPGEDEQVRTLQMSASGRVTATFVVTDPMTYSFRATMEDGTVIDEPMTRRVEIAKDDPPSIEILSHQGEVEVGTDDVLELEFSVQDDFGITGVTRVHSFGSEEDAQRKAWDITALQSGPKDHQGSHTLDLKEMGLQPKDRVTLYLEATDNNTLTGPGVGQSKAIVLVVASPDDKHMRNVAEQREILEALINSLADYLEAPVGQRQPYGDGEWRQVVDPGVPAAERTACHGALKRAHTREAKVLAAMGALSTRLEEDPMMVERDLMMFTSLHAQLDKLHDRGERLLKETEAAATDDQIEIGELRRMASWSMETEEALEKGILRLEDLLLSQQMANVQATAQEIKDLKKRLRELLLKYKETRDPELKAAIEREIQRLRQRMQELMRRMSSQMQQLPREHINREAIEQARMESDAKKMADSFTDIEEMLEKGDIDGALRALDQMGQNLDQMTQQMDSQFSNAQPQGLNKFDKKVGELMDDVNDLSQLQRDVEQDTRELQEQLEAQRDQQTEQMVERFKEKMLDRVAQQEADLKKMRQGDLPKHLDANAQKAQKTLEDLRESLEQGDVEGGLDRARQTLDDLENLKFSMQLSQRYMPKNSPKAKQIRESMKQTQPMIGRGEQMVDEFEQLMDEAQQRAERVDPRAQKLAERQQKVRERAEQLNKKIGEASKEFPMLEQQLKPGMEGAKKSMQQAEEGLKEQRTQRALDSERQALDQLRKMKQSMKDALQKQREQQRQSGRQVGRERVEIPDEGEGASSRYRDDIKKTMKEDRLKEYDSEIERYYESLVE